MQSINHLYFDSHLGRQKPESIVNRSTKCPFCDRDSLEGILEKDGPIVLLKNKYPVIKDAFMTVLIETDDCEEELSTYKKPHLYRVMRFGIRHWLEMENSGLYRSVLFFKNHGPLSGGSIYHPHMQIVGLTSLDYQDHVRDTHFEGIAIDQQQHVQFNLSVKPRVGFFEFNVLLEDLSGIEQMADYIQTAVHYLLNHFHRSCTSYNLFFYKLDDKIAAKIVPRFPTSPIYIGYSIPQVSNRIEDVAAQIRHLYAF